MVVSGSNRWWQVWPILVSTIFWDWTPGVSYLVIEVDIIPKETTVWLCHPPYAVLAYLVARFGRTDLPRFFISLPYL
ncbi:hypothetical protein B0T24DRAFT_620784 [Lasiosphaeria ovina]|uniref:Uncharacterized protein n=1 Tax=Lasiosphaeria ovina TaxID=92902 RepID=A0AAE0KJ49_9PEZI|nr:hypothetical protein B0T24DRAFT_620784 [Lasiosphaeria ovina]